MAEVKIGIAKTPKQAEKLGRTITESVTLTETEARKLRDYYAAFILFSFQIFVLYLLIDDE